jgi:hypothetical protein
MNEIMSANAFRWFLTILTGGLAGTWMIYDAISLIRLRRRGESPEDDPIAGDKAFGYVIGMIIGAIGLWGCLRFHGVV